MQQPPSGVFDVLFDDMLREVLRHGGPAQRAVWRAVCVRFAKCVPRLAHAPTPHEYTALATAADSTDTLLVFLEQQGCLHKRRVTQRLAFHGRLAGLRRMHNRGYRGGRGVVRVSQHAAEGGHQHVLEWLKKKRYPFDAETCDKAALNGHLDIVRWLHAQGCPLSARTIGYALASDADRDEVRAFVVWAVGAGDDMGPYACTTAVEIGDLPLLQWLHSLGFEWDHTVIQEAVLQCRWDMVQYLSDNGCPNTSSVFAAAVHAVAATNDTARLLWLRDAIVCPWSMDACHQAARDGSLAILQWLRAQGCLWDELTPDIAAQHGHLAVLQYLMQQGCPYDIHGVCVAAAGGGALDVLQWVCRESGGFVPRCCHPVIDAAKGGHLGVLQYLHARGCPWDAQVTLLAAEQGRLDVVQFAHESGCAWHADTCLAAIRKGHLAVAQYARDRGCPWKLDVCLREAPTRFIREALMRMPE